MTPVKDFFVRYRLIIYRVDTCKIVFEEELEDTIGVIRICISKKNRQNNGQYKKKSTKDKQRSTKHTYKTKARVTRTPLKSGGELR